MERLTEWIEGEDRAIPRVDLRRCGHEKCTTQLARYEDTGLTPQEVRELKERDTAKMCKQSIFDRDGMTCTCGSDLDKDVEFRFCPWCGQRLKKWED